MECCYFHSRKLGYKFIYSLITRGGGGGGGGGGSNGGCCGCFTVVVQWRYGTHKSTVSIYLWTMKRVQERARSAQQPPGYIHECSIEKVKRRREREWALSSPSGGARGKRQRIIYDDGSLPAHQAHICHRIGIPRVLNCLFSSSSSSSSLLSFFFFHFKK